jgi:hypothetical protein
MTSQTPNTSNQEKALAAFVARKAEIDERLARLQALSDDHFEVHPDEVTWGTSATSDATPSSCSGSPTSPSAMASTPPGFGDTLAAEADLVQSTAGARFPGTLEERLELGAISPSGSWSMAISGRD